MSALSTIRPTQRLKVMDLAKGARLDVTDWANYANGAHAPAANPLRKMAWHRVGRGRGARREKDSCTWRTSRQRRSDS